MCDMYACCRLKVYSIYTYFSYKEVYQRPYNWLWKLHNHQNCNYVYLWQPKECIYSGSFVWGANSKAAQAFTN